MHKNKKPMGFAASFEIRSLLNDNDDGRRYSRFPRTARLRSLLAGVVVLAVLVFGLNLIESSQIPSADLIGRGETKSSRDSSSSAQSSDSTVANDDTATDPTPQQEPQQISTAVPTIAPTSSLRPGNNEPSEQVTIPGQPDSSPVDVATNSPVDGSDVTLTDDYVSESVNSQEPTSQTNPTELVSNFTYPEAIVPVMSNASKTFVERWCDLEGTEWYPTGDSSWKLRAPAFLIPGAKYSGIFAITNLLENHPQIRPPSKGPETKFFFDNNFQKYVQRNEKTTVMQARERLLAQNYPALDFQKSPGSITYDATSGYLFRSNVLPRRLLCVLPWIKIVILLRDPIDRLYDHYLAVKHNHNLPHDLEDWIQKDMDLMQESGLISNSTGKTSNKKEDEKWYEYQHNAVEGPLGRSLYEIQIRHWFQALRAIGHEPKDKVLIIRTEDLVAKPQKEFKRLLKFLGLSEYEPESWDIIATLADKKSDAISKETRKLLKEFFKPYQARLEKLLEKYKVPYGSGGSSSSGKQKVSL